MLPCCDRPIETSDHERFRRAPVDPSVLNRVSHRLSRRAMLVGLTTVLIAGNTIAWSLLLNRRPQTLALGSTLLTYQGHTDWVNAVAWSPDGTRIASASEDGTVQVLEAI